jgi:hypothetical protein
VTTSDEVVKRARALASNPDVDVELAAGDLLEAVRADEAVLNTAREQLTAQTRSAEDDVARRALAIVTAAADVGYGGE